MTVKAYIMAAGIGSRLRPITDSVPKCLVPCGGRPLMDYWFDNLREAGVQDVFVNVHAHPEQVHSYLSRINSTEGFRVKHAYESTLLGSAGTLSLHRRFGEDADHVIVIYGDNYSEASLTDMLQSHLVSGQPVTMLLYKHKRPKEAGIVNLDDNGMVVDFEEKPENPKGDLANGGVYIFTKEAFKEIADMRVRDLGFNVFPKFLGRIGGYRQDCFHIDVGNPVNLAHAVKASYNREISLYNAPAVFTDRDGTLIESVPYLNDRNLVKPLKGAVDSVRRLKAQGYKVIVITNQSGVGRGKISNQQLHEVNARVNDVFEGLLDDFYWNTFMPATTDRSVIESFDRKPGQGLLWKACIAHGIDLRKSFMVGDTLSDVHAGRNAGCLHNFSIGLTGKLPPATTPVDSFENATNLILTKCES